MIAYLSKPLTDADLAAMRKALAKQPRKLSGEPCCDFCGGPKPVAVYAASRMSTGVEVRCWRWCACQGCKALIKANDWDALRAQIEDWCRRQMPMPAAITRKAAAHSFREFLDYAIKEENIS